ncbi:MAG: pilus assembly protein [Candidatus Liberibacter europaeus]|uniref:Pilus assembly protein n=1 Tax=Candidatus Liberibacter europaeus TaxID=744859 RepID=A0A2T4VXJ9_9HYPH|nr:pilus assembly protein [Candidatus Liberibacter europaeus]PTL86499.1 MAG: pilus assembly protein [Candidatus Liberibacter europaeus]
MEYIGILVIVVLVSFSVFALVYSVFYSQTDDVNSILDSKKNPKSDKNNKSKSNSSGVKRRKALLEAMQKIEEDNKKKFGNKAVLSSLISYSGLPISKNNFYISSCVLGFFSGIIALILVHSLFVIACISLSSALILPRLLLKFIIKKRQAKFLDEFPNALDIIVRSVRSGLPVSDAIAVIVNQSPDPVKTEFRRVVEAQHLGLSVSESVARMVRYMPLQEVAFFATVISIQAQSGGNLSEALSNLSKILRDRKKMKAKVQALAMEAKASGWIIGSLPFIVSLLVYFTSPEYLRVLFVDPRGHMLLGVAAFFMLVGILVMRSMINFEV